jgi:hypothetical protein
MKFETVDRITRPAKSSGVAWGSPIVVLARMGPKELWWEGGQQWQGDYFPRELYLVTDGDLRWRKAELETVSRRLVEGGRLSRALFAAHAEAIDAFFVPGTAERLHPRKTVIITTEPDNEK